MWGALGYLAQGALSRPHAVPRLQVSPGLTAVLVEVRVATVELNYTLRLYHNHSHGSGGSGRAVTAVSACPFLSHRCCSHPTARWCAVGDPRLALGHRAGP